MQQSRRDSRPAARRAVSSDAIALADFAARIFVTTFGPLNKAEDIDAYLSRTYGADLQRREIEDRNIVTLLIEDGATLIAFAQLRLERDAIEIARFYVDEAWHGRGIARQLMDGCIDVARSSRVPRIWLGVWEKNARAIAFYAKCGFRDIGSHPFLLGSDLQTDREMELRLTSPASRS